MNIPANLWVQIIIAIAAIASATFAYFTHRKNAKKIKELEKSLKISSRHNPNYSYWIEKQTKIFNLKDSGDAEIETIYENVKPNQDFRNLKIPYRFVVEGENADLMKPTVTERDDSDLPVELRDYKSEKLSDNHHKFTGNFTVLGHCEPDSCNISFASQQKVKGGYALTKAQALKLYSNSPWPHEYVSTVVMVKMGLLIITVNFPYKVSDMSGKPFPVAFCNGTYTIHQEETKLIKEKFKIENNIRAEIQIEDPTPGLTYAISWMPPK